MPAKVDRIFIVNAVLITEGVLLLTATIWLHVMHLDLLKTLTPNLWSILQGAAVGLATAAASLILYWLSLSSWGIFRALAPMRALIENELAPLFAQVTVLDILLLSAASGFCEEIFFRGVMLQQFGLFPSSLMFGIMHGPNMRQIQYALWAFLVGILFGWLCQTTHSLWTPIAAHTANNVLGLLVLRHIAARQQTKEQP